MRRAADFFGFNDFKDNAAAVNLAFFDHLDGGSQTEIGIVNRTRREIDKQIASHACLMSIAHVCRTRGAVKLEQKCRGLCGVKQLSGRNFTAVCGNTPQ